MRLIASKNFHSLNNYDRNLFNLIRAVGKVELISTFTRDVCECWNMNDKYTWDNAGDLMHQSIPSASTPPPPWQPLYDRKSDPEAKVIPEITRTGALIIYRTRLTVLLYHARY